MSPAVRDQKGLFETSPSMKESIKCARRARTLIYYTVELRGDGDFRVIVQGKGISIAILSLWERSYIISVVDSHFPTFEMTDQIFAGPVRSCECDWITGTGKWISNEVIKPDIQAREIVG